MSVIVIDAEALADLVACEVLKLVPGQHRVANKIAASLVASLPVSTPVGWARDWLVKPAYGHNDMRTFREHQPDDVETSSNAPYGALGPWYPVYAHPERKT